MSARRRRIARNVNQSNAISEALSNNRVITIEARTIMRNRHIICSHASREAAGKEGAEISIFHNVLGIVADAEASAGL